MTSDPYETDIAVTDIAVSATAVSTTGSHSWTHDRRARSAASADGVWERHVEIERAKGALIAIFGLTADEAFTVLSEQSQKRNIKLFVLAGKIMSDFERSRPVASPIATARDALDRMFGHLESTR